MLVPAPFTPKYMVSGMHHWRQYRLRVDSELLPHGYGWAVLATSPHVATEAKSLQCKFSRLTI